MRHHASTGRQTERWLTEVLTTDYVTREWKNTALYLLQLQNEKFYGHIQIGYQQGLPNTVKEQGSEGKTETMKVTELRNRARSL
jgi:hypothetical protein